MDSLGLGDRLDEVRSRVAAAAARSGRSPAAVTVIAVTKGHPAAAVVAAASAGLVDVGESRVQEARAKRRDVADVDIRWHLIGHLQHNKARAAAAVFDTVQSVDSARVAAALAAARGERPRLRVLLDIELTGLPGRSGVVPAAIDALVAAVVGLAPLELAGLMTIAAPGSPATTRATFARLRELRDALRGRHGLALDELSMGMSDDFEVAVEEGATMVRLGRVLFGGRRAVAEGGDGRQLS